MEKSKLRKTLFNEYLKEKDGKNIIELLRKTQFIEEVWNNLYIILEDSIEEIDNNTNIEYIKLIDNYLIIKTYSNEYFIINLSTNDNYIFYDYENNHKINRLEEVKDIINNKNTTSFNYKNKKQILFDYYEQNKELLSLPKQIICKYKLGNAITFFVINLANGYSYLSFETEDQYIYEHLFLDRDLNPLKLQDIQSRMSLDEIQELLLKIRDIIVPTEIVPKEINKIINNNITKK